ncbi:MAG: hypothetical protein M4579_006712 [Chaenotheca gracillima]|nr:MAG: hypothetical protein M4579_006712 [Chaenotheca gracillima]
MPGRVFSHFPGVLSPRPRASPVETEHIVNGAMQTLKDFRRRSLERPRSARSRESSGTRSSRKSSPKRSTCATLAVKIESPPVVLYGSPTSSSGAILSGQLRLDVEEAELRIESFKLVFNVSVTTNKPVAAHCSECSTKTDQLSRWDFLKDPVTLKRGQHTFPFSYLLGGHLPASVQTLFGDIAYSLSATAVTARGETISFNKPIKVQRAIQTGSDKKSVRLFPPTNITAHVSMNPVIHPIGDFTVYFRLVGMVHKEKQSQIRWRLRRLIWRIEEEFQMISPACAKHAHKIGGDGKGVKHTENRVIGNGEFKSGWKGNPSENNGEVEMEFQAAIKPGKSAVCNVQAASGLTVSHKMIIEMVVAEEWCPNNNVNSVTPTGSARILRMQFDLVVTERSGLGISWDEEQPPMYSDVPPSPPTYTQMEDLGSYNFDQDEDVERLEIAS